MSRKQPAAIVASKRYSSKPSSKSHPKSTKPTIEGACKLLLQPQLPQTKSKEGVEGSLEKERSRS